MICRIFQVASIFNVHLDELLIYLSDLFSIGSTVAEPCIDFIQFASTAQILCR